MAERSAGIGLERNSRIHNRPLLPELSDDAIEIGAVAKYLEESPLPVEAIA